MISTMDLCRLGSLVYPIMLVQEMGEISESRAAELLNMGIEKYRDEKAHCRKAIMSMVSELPSPLILLLDGTKGQQDSSMRSG